MRIRNTFSVRHPVDVFRLLMGVWGLLRHIKTRTTELARLRLSLRVSRTAKKTNEWSLSKAGVKRELLVTAKARKLAYYGHTMRKLEMWANVQRDGRPVEYRWRPLFNAAKFG